MLKDETATMFAGLMEDYLNIPAFVCEMIYQKLKEGKYEEVIEYVVKRKYEISEKN